MGKTELRDRLASQLLEGGLPRIAERLADVLIHRQLSDLDERRFSRFEPDDGELCLHCGNKAEDHYTGDMYCKRERHEATSLPQASGLREDVRGDPKAAFHSGAVRQGYEASYLSATARREADIARAKWDALVEAIAYVDRAPVCSDSVMRLHELKNKYSEPTEVAASATGEG